jgi:chorismate mutase
LSDRLDALRLEIDSLDCALHDLLMKRVDLVLRERMEEGGATAVRPAREAILLRTLARRHSGAMAFPVIARIYREILAGQAPLEIHFLAPEDPLLVIEMARAHFGASANLHRAGSAAIVLERVRTAPCALGLLPVPGSAAEKWWLRLLSEVDGAPRVVARLPALEPRDPETGSVRGLVVACGPCEPSGEDRSLLAIEAGAGSSPSGIERALGARGLRVRLLDRAHERSHALYLFEADGFLTGSDAILKPPAPIERIHLVGTYPVPLEWPPAPPAEPNTWGDVVTLPIRTGEPS